MRGTWGERGWGEEDWTEKRTELIGPPGWAQGPRLRCPHQLAGSHTRTSLPLDRGTGGKRLGGAQETGLQTGQSFCCENPANVWRLDRLYISADLEKPNNPAKFTVRSLTHVTPPNLLTVQPPGPPCDCPQDEWLLPLGLGFPRCEMRGECPSYKATPVCGDPGRGRPRETLRTGPRGPEDARRAGGQRRGRRRPVRSDSAPDRGPRLLRGPHLPSRAMGSSSPR